MDSKIEIRIKTLALWNERVSLSTFKVNKFVFLAFLNFFRGCLGIIFSLIRLISGCIFSSNVRYMTSKKKFASKFGFFEMVIFTI